MKDSSHADEYGCFFILISAKAKSEVAHTKGEVYPFLMEQPKSRFCGFPSPKPPTLIYSPYYYPKKKNIRTFAVFP